MLVSKKFFLFFFVCWRAFCVWRNMSPLKKAIFHNFMDYLSTERREDFIHHGLHILVKRVFDLKVLNRDLQHRKLNNLLWIRKNRLLSATICKKNSKIEFKLEAQWVDGHRMSPQNPKLEYIRRFACLFFAFFFSLKNYAEIFLYIKVNF